MNSSYNPWLVSLSIAVAILVSFTSLRLASRVAESNRAAGRAWLVLGAISMGVGIWAMHFIGMLAFSLPIQLRYDLGLTFGSLGVAILTSGFAIKIASSPNLHFGRHAICSLVMGLGIVTMHYTGMGAIRIVPAISYDAALVAASVAIAITASFIALWLTFNLTDTFGRPDSAQLWSWDWRSPECTTRLWRQHNFSPAPSAEAESRSIMACWAFSLQRPASHY
jgi:NO-binding membrane sensor protein with MHYT domain